MELDRVCKCVHLQQSIDEAGACTCSNTRTYYSTVTGRDTVSGVLQHRLFTLRQLESSIIEPGVRASTQMALLAQST